MAEAHFFPEGRDILTHVERINPGDNPADGSGVGLSGPEGGQYKPPEEPAVPMPKKPKKPKKA